jgi:Mg-chelatase subunit ChlD
MTSPAENARQERLRRWRLVLGGGEADGTGAALSTADQGMDGALAAVYEGALMPAAPSHAGPGAGLGPTAPAIARWLGDIRAYFPSTVVRVIQKDAVARLGLAELLLEPEVLEAVEPDVHLVATLLALSEALPPRAYDAARVVIGRLAAAVEQRLAEPTRQAITGALRRAGRTRRPRPGDVDWDRTIRANLRHYRPELGTVIPEVFIGYGRAQPSVQRELILAIDQSGSMASSVVYAGILGAVLATVRTLRTSLVAFDTAVADLTGLLPDPVSVLLATRLGGGTDINRALRYCQGLVHEPRNTILVLISDLMEGGPREQMLRRAADLAGSGVAMVALLALSDDGAPVYDHANAASLAALGIPAFACSPDVFPELLAAAVQHRDLRDWAAVNLAR